MKDHERCPYACLAWKAKAGLLLLLFLAGAVASYGQPDLATPFRDCGLAGSCTVYDYNQKKWIFSDSIDATKVTLPASTFKIMHLLIALEEGVVKDENEVVKWAGKTDTIKYGFRPETYRDLTVKEAFELSVVWVFMELSGKVGREKYRHYLRLCGYGNCDLSEHGEDFWNFGPMAISPLNQVEFLVRLHEGKLPFSDRSREIVKKVMVTEMNTGFTIRSKTGWARNDIQDIGWWVGYVERKENHYFFATRVTKNRSTIQPGFANCRKEITRKILRQLNAIK